MMARYRTGKEDTGSRATPGTVLCGQSFPILPVLLLSDDPEKANSLSLRKKALPLA